MAGQGRQQGQAVHVASGQLHGIEAVQLTRAKEQRGQMQLPHGGNVMENIFFEFSPQLENEAIGRQVSVKRAGRGRR